MELLLVLMRRLRQAGGALVLQALALAVAFAGLSVLTTLNRLHAGGEVPGADCSRNVRWLTVSAPGDVPIPRMSRQQLDALHAAAPGITLIPHATWGLRIGNGRLSREGTVVFTQRGFFRSQCIGLKPAPGTTMETGNWAVIAPTISAAGLSVEAVPVTTSATTTAFRGFLTGPLDAVSVWLPLSSAQRYGVDVNASGIGSIQILVVHPDSMSWADTTASLQRAVDRASAQFGGPGAAVRLNPSLTLNAFEINQLDRFIIITGIVAGAFFALALANLFTFQASRAKLLLSDFRILRLLGARRRHALLFVVVEPALIALLAWLFCLALVPFALKALANLALGDMLQSGLATGGGNAWVSLLLAIAVIVVLSAVRLIVVRRAGLRLGRERWWDRYWSVLQATSAVIAVGLGVAALLAYLHAVPWNMRFDPSGIRLFGMLVEGGVEHPLLEQRVASAVERMQRRGVSMAFADNDLPIRPPLLPWIKLDVGGHKEDARVNFVSGNFFDIIRLPFVAGSGFPAGYRSAPGTRMPAIAVINRDLALSLFGTEQAAVGRVVWGRLSSDDKSVPPTAIRITGVVDEGSSGNARQEDWSSLKPTAYLPFSMINKRATGFSVFIKRNDLTATELRSTVLTASAWLAPQPAINDEVDANTALASTRKRERAMAVLLGLLALGAIGMSALGAYGMFSLARINESADTALRFALGRSRRQLSRAFLQRHGIRVLVGIVSGAFLLLPGLNLVEFGLHGIKDTALVIALTFVVSAITFGLPLLLAASQSGKFDALQLLRGAGE
jgi:hypothetical protein